MLDVWRRQWVTTSINTTTAERAYLFIVNLRCLESQLEPCLCLSGRSGVFLKPRLLDAREPHLDFQVLWLPKTEKDELARLQQCNPTVLGLARVGSRLGLRTKLADAPALAKTLKPGSVFLASGARFHFRGWPAALWL